MSGRAFRRAECVRRCVLEAYLITALGQLEARRKIAGLPGQECPRYIDVILSYCTVSVTGMECDTVPSVAVTVTV